MTIHFRRYLRWLLAIMVILLSVRALLPIVVRHYLNGRMDRMGDYHGQIADVDLHLWRGAYTINHLSIVKITGKLPLPLLDAKRTDISLSWLALTRGVLRGKLDFIDPTVNFIQAGDAHGQTGKGVDWRNQLKLLAPMRLDELNIRNGTITFQSFVSNPRVDLKMTQVNASVSNLTNIQKRSGKRVAELRATARILDDASFETRATFDPLHQLGDFAYELRATDIHLVKANALARAYAGLDFAAGTGDFTMELQAKDGRLEGYAKPIFHGLKMFSWKKDVVQEKKGPLKLAYEALAQGVVSVFKNQAADQFATRVPISGQIGDKQADTSTAIIGILHNAFVQAYSPQLEKLKPSTDPARD